MVPVGATWDGNDPTNEDGAGDGVQTSSSASGSAVREPSEMCDGRAFRGVIGHFASGVTVISATHDGVNYGITANAVTSVSVEPPTLAACVNRSTGTYQAIRSSGRFAVNILHDGQSEIAERFATAGENKYAGVAVSQGKLGVPILESALAHMECSVESESDGGSTHAIFVARVVFAEAKGGTPLAYFRGAFGHLELEGQTFVYEELRARTLDRRLKAGDPLDVAALAAELTVEEAWVHHAMTKLASDGLVARHPQLGWVIIPVDEETSDATNDARCVIELGVVESSIESATPEQLAELRHRMEDTLHLIENGHFVDVARYNEANNLFHECLVGLANAPVLLDSYRRLSMPSIMARSLSPSSAAPDQLALDHLELVLAFEAKDVSRAKDVVRNHSARAKNALGHAIRESGGAV